MRAEEEAAALEAAEAAARDAKASEAAAAARAAEKAARTVEEAAAARAAEEEAAAVRSAQDLTVAGVHEEATTALDAVATTAETVEQPARESMMGGPVDTSAPVTRPVDDGASAPLTGQVDGGRAVSFAVMSAAEGTATPADALSSGAVSKPRHRLHKPKTLRERAPTARGSDDGAAPSAAACSPSDSAPSSAAFCSTAASDATASDAAACSVAACSAPACSAATPSAAAPSAAAAEASSTASAAAAPLGTYMPIAAAFASELTSDAVATDDFLQRLQRAEQQHQCRHAVKETTPSRAATPRGTLVPTADPATVESASPQPPSRRAPRAATTARELKGGGDKVAGGEHARKPSRRRQRAVTARSAAESSERMGVRMGQVQV